MNASDILKNSKRIIIKIGSVLVTKHDTGVANHDWLQSLASDINSLINDGKEIIIVTSGSIALGRKHLSLGNDKKGNKLKIEEKQAAASIGQMELMSSYLNAFSSHNLKISQVLLSPFDTENRRSHINARATLNTLLENNIIPIVNENDSVTTKEIRFGDNDRLAARVGQMVGADLLILLSTIDGLYTNDPSVDLNADHIPIVEKLDSQYMSMGKDVKSGISTGGMKSKLQAADIAVNSGITMIITDGRPYGALKLLVHGEIKSTIFKSLEKPAKARKNWILSHFKHDGCVIIDAGAVHALLKGNSLLPVGVISLEGNFERGAIISVLDEDKNIIAVGISSYSSVDISKIKKCHSPELEKILGYIGREEIIHRSNLSLKN